MLRILAVVVVVLGAAISGARAQDDLPPDVRFDILRLELSNAARDSRHKDVLAIAGQMRKLGQPMPADTVFFEGRAFHALGALAMARRALTTYLKQVDRDNPNYEEAIRLYVSIKAALDAKTRADAAREQLRAAWEAAHAAWLADRARVQDWKKRAVVFGGPGEDSAVDIAHSPEGGIVVAGALHVRNDKDGKPVNATLPWITAFDARGRRVWHHPLGSAEDAGSLRSVVAVPGRGYLFGGMQKGFQIVAMTDPVGNAAVNGEGDPWIMAFAPAPNGEGGLGRLLPGGDVLALGAEEVGKDERTGKAVARLPVAVRLAPDGKPRGKTVFARAAGTLWFDVKDALVQPGGHVIVAGETRRDGADAASAEGYLLRIAPDSRELWLKRIASQDGSGMALTAIAPYGDAGVIATGRDGNALVWLAVDGDGNVLWRKRRAPETKVAGSDVLCAEKTPAEALTAAYRGRNDDAARAVSKDLGAVVAFACRRGRPFAAGTAIIRRASGGYVVLGVAGHNGESATRVTVTAVDDRGGVLWEQRHGDEGASLATAALATGDGGTVAAGVTTSWGRDVALFRTDAEGRLQSFSALAPAAAPQPNAAKERKTTKPMPAAADESKSGSEPGVQPPVTAVKPDDRAPVAGETAPSGGEPDRKAQVEAPAPASNEKKTAPSGEEPERQPEVDLLDLLGDLFSASPDTEPRSARSNR